MAATAPTPLPHVSLSMRERVHLRQSHVDTALGTGTKLQRLRTTAGTPAEGDNALAGVGMQYEIYAIHLSTGAKNIVTLESSDGSTHTDFWTITLQAGGSPAFYWPESSPLRFASNKRVTIKTTAATDFAIEMFGCIRGLRQDSSGNEM